MNKIILIFLGSVNFNIIFFIILNCELKRIILNYRWRYSLIFLLSSLYNYFSFTFNLNILWWIRDNFLGHSLMFLFFSKFVIFWRCWAFINADLIRFNFIFTYARCILFILTLLTIFYLFCYTVLTLRGIWNILRVHIIWSLLQYLLKKFLDIISYFQHLD